MQKALEGHNLHCVHQNKADCVQHITVITCSEGLQRSLQDPIDYNDSTDSMLHVYPSPTDQDQNYNALIK